MTLQDLWYEYIRWGPFDRDEFDQRFGQYIFNKYGVDFGNSYNVEHQEEAFNILAEGLKDG